MKLGRLLLKEKAKKNKETKYSARRGCHIKKEVGELKEGSTYWGLERERNKDSKEKDFFFLLGGVR